MEVFGNIPLLLTILMVMGVVFVNGWTDAPNAIATVVSTRSMKPQSAVFMAAVFNFLGMLIMTFINSEVMKTVYSIMAVDLDAMGNIIPNSSSLVLLCASLFGIVVWAVAAWYFGIPTSESHALIAGLTGGGIAISGGFGGINWDAWGKVLYGLVLSSVLGFAIGFVVVKLVTLLFGKMKRATANRFFSGAQIAGGASMAFMHGAQDGQKFMGVFVLSMMLGGVQVGFNDPWLVVLISAVMGIGTSIGGYRIIKAVGMDMIKLEKYQGFSADLAATVCLLVAQFTALPVSTTHTKTTAIMGVGSAKSKRALNWGIVGEMATAWILTFPGCALLSYGFCMIAKLFMKL